MYSNKKVRDIMVPIGEYPVIYEDTPVSEAVGIMRDSFHRKDGTWYGFQSVLVMNRKGKLVGLLTLRGFLKAFKIQAVLEHLLKGDPEGLIFMPPFYNGLEILTRDIMRPLNLITVQADSSIFQAMVTVVEGKVNSLPVMSGRDLVGVVRTIDLFWAVGEFLD
ncbi:MAG: CBS domain-containing protein [Peptococcaceae bacterium]|nr:CBS domain-containing protein [Peptococcaceae bacterium]